MPLSAFSILTIAFLLCSLKNAASEEYTVAPDLNDSLVDSSGLTLSQFAADSLDYWHSNATLSLFIQPGLHILSHSLVVIEVDTFSMVSNNSTSQIMCDSQSAISFFRCKHLHISNVKFIGCENSEVHDTERFLLEDVVFRDSEYGTALEIINTTAQFIRTTFVSNHGGKLLWILVPTDSLFQYFKMAGSALIAKDSNITISENTFVDNEAEIGGALYVENSIITIQGTDFSINHVVCRLEVDYFSNYTFCFCNSYLGEVLFTYRSNITIERTTFYNNSACRGGVIYSYDSNITITMCIFYNNSAEYTGGIFESYSSNIIISSSSFQYNSAINIGGVMDSYNDAVLVENSTFQDNYSGGVLNTYGSDIEVSSCSFIANVGGVLDLLESSISIENSDFSFNSSPYSGGVLHWSRSSNITVKDCTFNENKADIAAVLEANDGSIAYFYGSLTVNRNSGSHIMYFTASTSFFMERSIFSNNNGNSLKAFDSNVTFIGTAQFVNNTSPTIMEGGVVTLFQSNLYCNGMLSIEHNKAENGGGVYSLESSIYMNGEVTIAHNIANGSGGGIYLANSALACSTGSSLQLSSNKAQLNGGGVYATGSSIKAVVTYTSTGYAGAVICFVSNRAEKGGGLSLEGSTKIYVMKYRTAYTYTRNPPIYSAIVFEENMAMYGGGIYMNDVTNTPACDSKQHAECFFQVLAIYGDSIDYNNYINPHNIHFVLNHATHSGFTLYGGLLDRCAISSSAEVRILDKYKGRDRSGLTYLNDSSINVVANDSIFSDPMKVCICMDNDTIICPQRYDTPREVKKGEEFYLSVVAVDQAEHPINATIQSSLKHTSSGLGEGQLTRPASMLCTNLSFMITSGVPHMRARS